MKLKREVAALERAVFVKEKEHEQDSVVKIQLGKRLEQVLLDKEEAYEELEQLQVFYLSQLYLYSALPYPPTPPVSAAPSKCSLIAILYHMCIDATALRVSPSLHLYILLPPTIPPHLHCMHQIKLSTLKSAMSNMDFRVTAAMAASPAKK